MTHSLSLTYDLFLSQERYLRTLRNFFLSQPYEHCRYFRDLALLQTYWSVEEKITQLEKLTVGMCANDVLSFPHDFSHFS